MTGTFDRLTSLLRHELAAVQQHGFHMHVLRQLNREVLLNRITNVDTNDFKNVMQTIDLFVLHRSPIKLDPYTLSLGSDATSIVQSEFQMEKLLAAVLVDMEDATDPMVSTCIKRAAAPRQPYRDWLAEQIEPTSDTGITIVPTTAMAEFFAHLLALMEQALLHAFLNLHRGNSAGTDNAWRLSGAAMLYCTALIRCGGAIQTLPMPAIIPGVHMSETPEEAFAADTEMSKRCAELGRRAANTVDDEETHRACLNIVNDCDLIVGMKKDGEFSGIFGRRPIFESFAPMYEKHVRQ